jgi:hypothetical protein
MADRLPSRVRNCKYANQQHDLGVERVLSNNPLVNKSMDKRSAPLKLTSRFEPQSPMADAVRSFTPMPAAHRNPDRDLHILLATTGHLPSTARLAMELHDAGARVSLIAPPNHPARVLDIISHRVLYSALSPKGSLEAALQWLRPDLVIPCDERTVRDLHQICLRTPHRDVRRLIERSVGPTEIFSIVTSRDALLELARRAGVRLPASMPLPDAGALDRWIADHPGRFVMKADGSWAGFGVRIISDAGTARDAFVQMTRPITGALALREMVLEGDSFGIRSWLRRERSAMSVQSYIDGWPANIGVACWQGELLAAICAESVATESATGPSTVVRIIDNVEMVDTARRVVKALGLSGLIGFDFMIEAASGAAFLIEMNPRNTPICAVRLGPGRDLAEALVARLACRPPRERPSRTERDIVVFFPDMWRQNPSNPDLQNGYHDVPWEQPALVRFLVKPELRDRYWVMRMLRRLWLKIGGGRLSAEVTRNTVGRGSTMTAPSG